MGAGCAAAVESLSALPYAPDLSAVPAPPASGCRLLVIGLDAAEPSLLRRWAAMGKLPTLAALMEGGIVRSLAHEPGLYTGSVWPSLFTGRSAGAHGRYNNLQLVPGSYCERRFDPAMLGADPFWLRFPEAGLRALLFDLPKMPVSAGAGSLLVRDWGTHDAEGPLATVPKALAEEIRDVGGGDPVGSCDSFDDRSPRRERLTAALCERVGRRTELALHLLGKGPFDLAFLAFSETHCGGHHLWRAHHAAEAGGKGDDPAANPYLRLCQTIDAAIARIVAAVGASVPVLLFASHGMGDHFDATHLLDRALRRLDLDTDRPGFWRGSAAALYRLRTPLPRGLRDRLDPAILALAQRALARDRARRRWFQVATNDNAAGVRLNLVGREPRGLIPADEAEATRDFLRSRLLELRNADTGKPAFAEVVDRHKAFSGGRSGDLPDLVLLWNQSREFAGLAAPWCGELRGRFRGSRVGDHRAEGMLIAGAPGLRPDRQTGPIPVMAVAPTICAALGLQGAAFDAPPLAEFVAAVRDARGARRQRHPMEAL